MIYDHFRSFGAHEAALDLSDLSNVSSPEDDIRTRWDQALSSASEVSREHVLESLCKMKLRESVQLQTVLAMYDREIDRNLALPRYPRLKTVVRRHVDQMIRKRNFKTRSERIETGVLVKSHKGRNVRAERKVGDLKVKDFSAWEECYQWKANGQCSRGDSCSFSHGSNRGQQAQSSSLAPKARCRHRLTEGSPRKVLVPGEKVLLEGKAELRAETS